MIFGSVRLTLEVHVTGVPKKNEKIVLVSLEGRKATIVRSDVYEEKEV